ncbi:MAG: hypothetical protein ACOCZK_03585 [Planctomycetota bacterium]
MTEELEAYEVEIRDGIAVTRVLSTTTTSAIYTTAQQTADWGAPLGPGDSLTIRIFQLLDHGVQRAIGADADGQHAAQHICLCVRGGDKPLEMLKAVPGAVKLHVVAHDVLELCGEPQLGQPDGRLVRLEHRMGQLQVQQPVVLHLRLGALEEGQELLLRFLPQHPVLQA